jgi:hypothetical protein
MKKKDWESPEIIEVSILNTLGGPVSGTTEDEVNGIMPSP